MPVVITFKEILDYFFIFIELCIVRLYHIKR